jgi:hypothetical protein
MFCVRYLARVKDCTGGTCYILCVRLLSRLPVGDHARLPFNNVILRITKLLSQPTGSSHPPRFKLSTSWL